MASEHARFVQSGRRHVLMITNHGIHEWKVTPGLPDTGGQNVYVNQFTTALVRQGYRVTIVNRGGYPHPRAGEPRSGLHYDDTGFARILYIEDGTPSFVRKEDMADHVPALVADLHRRLAADSDSYDLILSHYWDAGMIGVQLRQKTGNPAPHVWIPHSLGALKKKNVDASTWKELRIDDRVEHERRILEHVDGAVATSTAIRETLKEDYGYTASYFLPPCIDTERIRPLEPEQYAGIWTFLAEGSEHSAEGLRERLLVTEISRTDKTKRKDVLMRAFAQARQEVPEALLVVTIDSETDLYERLMKLIAELALERHVIVLGSVWDQLPYLYNATSVYCTPSVMEGFGMSAQEAAATARPVVSSNLVPFVSEHLLGDDPERVSVDHLPAEKDLLLGEGGVVVPSDFVDGFAAALTRLLRDEALRTRMGQRALKITVPYFTWDKRSRDLLDDLGVTPD